MSDPQHVLVTGTSSGFGTLIAQSLLRDGHTVYATMREPDGRNAEAARGLQAFAEETDGRVHVLELDVTSDASVNEAVAQALAVDGRIDVVVNNAGVGAGGYAETFTADQFRQLFEINVAGVQRVHRAVLPSMRAAGRGLLIAVSSTMGRIVIPYSAPYTASKWALEGMMESYRYELAPAGIDVAIVEPGGFPTGIAGRLMTPGDPERLESYGNLKDMPDKMWGGFMEMLEGEGAPDSQLVADAVRNLVAVRPLPHALSRGGRAARHAAAAYRRRPAHGRRSAEQPQRRHRRRAGTAAPESRPERSGIELSA